MRLPLREVVSGRRRVRFLGAVRIRGMAGGGEETSDKEKNPKTGCRPVDCQCFTN